MNLPKQNLFKWIGGKNWLKKELYNTFNELIIKKESIYIEPFIGGMGSFKAMLPLIIKNNIKKIILNDINKTIILTYKYVKTNPKVIIELYKELENNYLKELIEIEDINKLHKTKDKEKLKILLKPGQEYFLKIRKEFNKLKKKESLTKNEELEMVSLFLFLQEHSFNGVYRENSKGEYNTPFNWDNKKYNIKNKSETILEYSELFNKLNIIFENMDVFELLNKYNNKNAILYLDPPYLNEDEKGENKYNKDHFGFKEQIKLLDLILKYNNFIYSNHYIETIVDFFQNNKIRFKKVYRKNIMNSKVENRNQDVAEILVSK